MSLCTSVVGVLWYLLQAVTLGMTGMMRWMMVGGPWCQSLICLLLKLTNEVAVIPCHLKNEAEETVG